MLSEEAYNRTSARIKAGGVSAFLHGPTFDIERTLIREGISLIAGIDEVGRGALAGPLCLGIVIFDASFIQATNGPLAGIDDSKKLTHRKRIIALESIRKLAILCTSILVSHRTVDRLGINGATEFALNRLIEQVPVRPECIILDGNFSFHSTIPIRSITKGDQKSISIASASIAAKVRRDLILTAFEALYPGYQFSKNKGYGTRGHIKAIHEAGICPVHRRSYEPLRSLLSSGEKAE